MIIIDKNKHPNLFEEFAKELNRCRYRDDHWQRISILKITQAPPLPHLRDNIFPGRFRTNEVKSCVVHKPWLENLLNQNETLLIEFTKARLGH